MRVTCRVTAQLAEEKAPLTAEERQRFIQRLEAQEQTRVRETLTMLQTWKCDCVGLTWGQAQKFEEINFQVDIQVDLQ
jgi:rubrerythrin